jgi:hypothetical protein
MKSVLAALVAATALAAPALAADQDGPPPVAVLPAAAVLARHAAEEATQGVAVDARHFYAVANFRIGKYDKATGRKVGEWRGSRALYPHLNHCAVLERQLVCANSNFPQLPMTSAVEFFEPGSLKHLRTVALGPGIGSLTWMDRKDGFWWATFANYDGNGGEPGRDHRFTTFVKFDDNWRRVEAWAFPATVLANFKPMSSSGGAWGDDGLLYVTGHDHGELYVLRLPEAGSVLEHVATIPVALEGQAVVWDRSQNRVLYGISRPNREVVALKIPEVPKP